MKSVAFEGKQKHSTSALHFFIFFSVNHEAPAPRQREPVNKEITAKSFETGGKDILLMIDFLQEKKTSFFFFQKFLFR